MSELKTKCRVCGARILQRTADRIDGRCMVCRQNAENPAQRFTPPPPELATSLDLQIAVGPWPTIGDVDWSEVENALVVITSHYLQAFGEQHSHEHFYGFAFDCNADYGQVFACLNTYEDLRRRAIQCKQQDAKTYQNDSIERLETKLRWSLGDWKYRAWNTERFSEAWSPIEEMLTAAEDSSGDSDFRLFQAFTDNFMKTACRAMVRLEAAKGFESLWRTSDFKTFVADHDELDEDSWRRLERIRAQNVPAS